MNFDLLKPGTVPMPPNTVLWFEFLLDPSLLEKHLAKPCPDPSPTDLILKFLAIAHDQKETGINEPIVIDAEQTENNHAPVNGGTRCSKKSLALKILALKVAAFLKWDISSFEKSLPLPVQQSLLLDLLSLSLDIPTDVSSHVNLVLSTLTPQALFAVTLYHRWLLRGLVYSELKLKQSPGSIYGPRPAHNGNVNGANLQDTSSSSPAVVDELLRTLEKQSGDSVQVLKSALELKQAHVFMPLFSTFQTLSEDTIDVTHNWDSHRIISEEEFHFQLHYDIGVYYFYRQELSLAREHFMSAAALYPRTPRTSHFCNISKEELDGYCKASGLAVTPKLSLLCQFHSAVKEQYTGIVGILLADNIAHEIPMVHRDQLELDIQGAISSGKFTVARDLLVHVQCLNIARRLHSGDLLCTDYAQFLRNSAKGMDLLYMSLAPVLQKSNRDADGGTSCRQRVKSFLKGLYKEGLEVFDNSYFVSLKLFEPDELAEIKAKTDPDLPTLLTSWNRPDIWDFGNPRLKIGTYEQQLILSYDSQEIHQLLMKIWQESPPTSQTWDMNSKWCLSIPMHNSLMSLSHSFLRDRSYIMLAKAQELVGMQEYERALELYESVERDIQSQTNLSSSIKFKINRLMYWEVIAVQALQFLEEYPSFISRTSSLAESCKSCLSARAAGETVIPRLEVMERCALLLLNVPQHHDILIKLDHMCSLIDVTAAFAMICQDIGRHKVGRIMTKDAWDLVLPAFYTIGAQKRNSSGAQMHHRDSPVVLNGLNLSSLWTFLSHLRDSMVLSVAISLLARICNVLKDDSKTEINADYVSIWPNSIPNSNSYQFRAVSEMLYQLLGQALKYHPNHIGWLKVLGDLNFLVGHHAAALKAYLEAAIASSDFFSQPLPKAVMTDAVYRRMIKCCAALQCHTQAAVLCQFLDDVDYTQAFKSLSETKSGSSADAMDGYYNCIWDITLLEYLVHMHTKRGETHRKQMAIQVIGLLELNSNNNEEIQREAANVRKARFLRAMAHQYVC